MAKIPLRTQIDDLQCEVDQLKWELEEANSKVSNCKKTLIRVFKDALSGQNMGEYTCKGPLDK